MTLSRKVPSRALLVEMVSVDGPATVCRELKALGFTVTVRECTLVRRELLAAKAGTVVNRRKPGGSGSTITTDPTLTAARGCAELEEAMCDLYARTAKRLGCRLETAAIVLNYSPAQIRKMAA